MGVREADRQAREGGMEVEKQTGRQGGGVREADEHVWREGGWAG